MQRNRTKYLEVIDTINNTMVRYDSIQIAAKEMGLTYGIIINTINKNKLYKNKFRFQYGEIHEKKVKVNIMFSSELLQELQKIYSTVQGANLVKLTNTICRDYVFNYKNEINNKKINI